MSNRIASKLSVGHQILLTTGGLVAASVLVLLLLTAKWMVTRTGEDVAYRLGRASATLKRLHSSASTLRLRRFESLATEPRFKALAEIQDAPTLKNAAQEQLKLLQCAAFGFFSPTGDVIAWEGAGAAQFPAALKPLVAGGSATIELMTVDGRAFEVSLVPMRGPDGVLGYLAAATAFDRSILQDYAVGVAAAVIELRQHETVLERSIELPDAKAETKTVDVKIPGGLKFVIVQDVSQVAAPFHAALRAMTLIAVACVLLATLAGYFVSRLISRPLADLVEKVRAIESGLMSVRVEEEGAPELRDLARSFNRMVVSLARTQDELKAYALRVEDRIRAKEDTRSKQGVESDVLPPRPPA